MRFNITAIGVGVGAGVVDTLVERNDAKNAATRTTLAKKWQTWSRFGLLAAGYAMEAFDFAPEVGSALAQSQLPLATKTAMDVIMPATTGTAAYAGSRYAGVSQPVKQQIQYTPGPGFDKVEVY